MRRCLMLLMICLLPLRLWAGDVMAMQHAPAVTHEAGMVMALSAHASHADAADATADACHGQAAEPDTPHPPSHAAACGSCDICHSQVATDTPAEWRSPELGQALRAEIRWTFDSAHALPCFKPPRA